ncbi:MAG: ATP12 family chaperone protein [Phenylobacterium sp.]
MTQKGFIEPGEKPRRFYSEVTVAPDPTGWYVLLDGRPPRSSRGAALIAPTRAIAELAAAEWAAQVDHIELAGMHATRLAFTALEAIPPNREGVVDQLVNYAGSDLLCYPAEAPEGLCARQAEAWDPVLRRARDELGVALEPSRGILHREQPGQALAAVRRLALSSDDFTLSGLAFGAPLFGSAVLALGLWKGWFGGEEALDLSRVDEAWQESQWGIDEEAAERTARLRSEARMLEAWFRGLEGAAASPA